MSQSLRYASPFGGDDFLTAGTRRASEQALCGALRSWCDSHDAELRRCARSWVRREVLRVRFARGADVRAMRALVSDAAQLS